MGLIRASAPGRAGILGNPSDIYGGSVLSCAIPARATCWIDTQGDLPEERLLWEALTRRLPIDAALVGRWQTEVPRSSGLSGSTALLAAMTACVLAARGEAPDLKDDATRMQVAELVRDIERHDAGIMCGYQDATVVVHGGLQLMDFTGKHPVIPGPSPTLERLAIPDPLPFLLVTTGVERLSGSVHGPMSERWLAGEASVRNNIARIGEMAPFGARAFAIGDVQTLADLMTENHQLVADLGGSGEAVDRLIDHCIKHGAHAAKLAGAGLGGTVIALTTEPDELEQRLRGEGYNRFLRPSAMEEGLRYEP